MSELKALKNIIVEFIVKDNDLNPTTMEQYANKMAQYILERSVKVLPCAEGDTVYRIAKCCEENTGIKEEFAYDKTYESDCQYLAPASWVDDSDRCTAVDDFSQGDYCVINCNILCEHCLHRFAIQKDKFEISMYRQVYGSPTFDEKTELYHMRFKTYEDAQKVLSEHISAGMQMQQD